MGVPRGFLMSGRAGFPNYYNNRWYETKKSTPAGMNLFFFVRIMFCSLEGLLTDCDKDDFQSSYPIFICSATRASSPGFNDQHAPKSLATVWKTFPLKQKNIYLNFDKYLHNLNGIIFFCYFFFFFRKSVTIF